MQKSLHNIICAILLSISCRPCSSSWNFKSNSKLKICPKEKISLNGTFEWRINSDDENNFIISQPDVCWNDNSIVLRKCNFETGEWFPNKVQCTKYYSKNNKCPDELTELLINNEYLCLKISSKKEAFDERSCYGTNLIIGYKRNSTDNEIIKFLFKEYQITSFWLPIIRYEEKVFNPFVIRLPGEHWNELFSFREWSLFFSNQTILHKPCIAAILVNDTQNNVEMEIETSFCSDLHYSVCIIEKHFVSKSGCPQNFGALSYRPNECYGITWDGHQYPEDFRILNIIEYLKNVNTINSIFEEMKIVNDKFVEVDGAVRIPDKKWAIKPKNNEIKIVASTKKLYGLCVEYIESRKNVQMLLRMDPDLDSLILTVYNKFYIWSNSEPEDSIYCFTNADYEELSSVEVKKIWENDSQTKTIFKLKIKSDYPGEYWCEAHTIFDFSRVSSSKIIGAKSINGHVFAMQVEVPLTQFEFLFNLSPDQMKYIATSIRKDIKNVRKSHKNLNDLIIHNVRIMEILNQNATHLHCICHTTISLKSSTDGTHNERNSEEGNDNQDGRKKYRATVVRMKARDLLVNLMQNFQQCFANTVLSTEFCFPENEWLLSRIGQTAVESKLCLQLNGLPATRKCLGDFIGGAYWESETMKDCINITDTNLLTNELHTIEQKNVPKEQIENTIRDVRKLLELRLNYLIPADIYYLARILSNSIKSIFKIPAEQIPTSEISKNQQTWGIHSLSETSAEIVRILNFLLKLNEHIIRPSVILNSTNLLLDAFENLIDHTSLLETFPENSTSPNLQNQIDDESEIEIFEFIDIGAVVKISTNFVAFVINPLVANVSGIALFRNDHLNSSEELKDEGSLRGAFRNDYYRFILANQSVHELLNEKNILMGTFVPTSLWQRLDEISMLSSRTMLERRPDPKIIIKIYANDNLFQETNLSSVVHDKIISISIPGHAKDLPEVLPLILTSTEEIIDDLDNKSEHQTLQSFCGYWNYQSWANDGVLMINRSRVNKNTILCGCTHLTPFAYLIGGSYNLSVDSDIEVIVKKIHKKALDIITLVGCSLSLFGIAGLFVTACTFRSWRKKANSKVLLQLSAAIALQMVLFCFINTEENSNHFINNQIYNSCIAIGASLHYSVLVQFCWMIIIAYLQFKRYVQVFGNTRPTRFFVKSALFGWGLPFLPVALVLFFDSDSYIPQQDKSTNPLCYPTGVSFYASLVFPITIVIIANLFIFLVVIYHLVKNPAGAIRHTEKSLALSQIRLLVLLFFLLGFTWIFGLLNIMKTALIFSYLFCMTATLQGFILFVYFVVLDPVTRRMWFGCFANMCGIKLGKENASSVKETTQSF